MFPQLSFLSTAQSQIPSTLIKLMTTSDTSMKHKTNSTQGLWTNTEILCSKYSECEHCTVINFNNSYFSLLQLTAFTH